MEGNIKIVLLFNLFLIVFVLPIHNVLAGGKTKVYGKDYQLKYRIEDNKIYDKDYNLKYRIKDGKIYDKDWNPKFRIEDGDLFDKGQKVPNSFHKGEREF